MEPNRSGKAGQYFNVLNADSLYGLSFETCALEWDLVTPRSTRSCATGFEVIEVPRSAWITSGTPCTAIADCISSVAMIESSRAATVQPTT